MQQFLTTISGRPVAIWLFVSCFFIFLMVGIGGVTRLTQSGLSITQWQPVSGIIPPFSESSWQEEFSRYQQSPEYIKKNTGMGLAEFKGIFWLEYIHRLVGRITGLIFLLPLLYFAIKRQISLTNTAKLTAIFALGGAQGVVGWYMVKSGLNDAPHVSHYWLAFHLGMALLIYGLLFFEGLKELNKGQNAPEPLSGQVPTALMTHSFVLLGGVFLQIILGAFVAGTHSGLAYNTFPDMNGQFIPDGMLVISPWYMNLLINTATIQFEHRMLAYAICIFVLLFWWFSRKYSLTKSLSRAVNALVLMVAIQLCLGIFTLLQHVPVVLASLHQMCAVVLFTLVIFINYELRKMVRS